MSEYERYQPISNNRVPLRGCLDTLALGLLLLISGAVLLVAVVTFGVYRTGEGFLGRVEQLFTAPQPTPVVDVRASVITQVRRVSELTTTVFVMETVANASKDRTLGPFTVGQTKLLYVAHGEVRAGVDLSQITPEDITVAGDTIVISLPPPRILDAKIDVGKSYVYDYEENFFAPPSPELQSVAEQTALQQIRAGACDADILQTANEEAELAIGSLLTAAGYANVTVLAQPPPVGECAPQ